MPLQSLWQAIAIFLALSLLLVITQRQQMYFPRRYNPAYTHALQQTIPIHHKLNSKKQVAYLRASNPSNIKHLWIVLGGNASLALDWLPLLLKLQSQETGFLLIDYPGYGQNDGTPTQAHNQQAALLAYTALITQLPGPQPKRYILAHSLGTGVAAAISAKFDPSAVILLSPFTSMYAMAQKLIGKPWAWLLQKFLWDKYPTADYLAKLKKTHPHIKVHILHGSHDNIVPVSMSRELFKQHPKWIHYQEIAHHGHDLPYTAEANILATIADIQGTGPF